MIVYVVGGEQHPNAQAQPTWAQYQAGIVAKIDTGTGESSVCLRHERSADSASSPRISTVFGASTLSRDRLYTCTKTEVHVYSVPAFRLLHRLSLPIFNDLHHVRPTRGGSLRVVVTGLDMVVDCTMTGSVTSLWNVVESSSPWTRFSPDVDYRQVASTKPHRSHPNFSFELGDDPWVTRLEQRDALCLTDRSRHMDIGIERPHDGIVTTSGVWFTTVDGRLVRVDRTSLRVDRVLEVGGGGPRRPGWWGGLGSWRSAAVDQGDLDGVVVWTFETTSRSWGFRGFDGRSGRRICPGFKEDSRP